MVNIFNCARKKKQLMMEPLGRKINLRIISDYDAWNFPIITQLYLWLNLLYIFYCGLNLQILVKMEWDFLEPHIGWT